MEKEQMKQEAIKRMKQLKLMADVVNDFEKNGRVYYSERQNKFFNAVLYWLDNQKEWEEKVKKFEEEHNCLVYHCQLTHLEFGDVLSLLFVSSNEKEWPLDMEDLKNNYAFAYCLDLSGPFSEFGTIGLKPSMGGVVRTA